ncbi:hypothetical protein STXM2123_347 [Streptomyces sp. F-3]|nr:hypothetical protein STXM2123_347 [Streptomyces sp. F-3]
MTKRHSGPLVRVRDIRRTDVTERPPVRHSFRVQGDTTSGRTQQ